MFKTLVDSLDLIGLIFSTSAYTYSLPLLCPFDDSDRRIFHLSLGTFYGCRILCLLLGFVNRRCGLEKKDKFLDTNKSSGRIPLKTIKAMNVPKVFSEEHLADSYRELQEVRISSALGSRTEHEMPNIK